MSWSEEQSLSASPTPMPPELVRRFRPDEIDESAPARSVPPLLESLRSGHDQVAEGEHRFRIAHHQCEVAEQWAFIEVPALTESSREAIAVDRCAASPVLKRCLAQPMTSLDLELYKPYFIFEHGVVRTEALASASTLAFVHELRSRDGKELRRLDVGSDRRRYQVLRARADVGDARHRAASPGAVPGTTMTSRSADGCATFRASSRPRGPRGPSRSISGSGPRPWRHLAIIKQQPGDVEASWRGDAIPLGVAVGDQAARWSSAEEFQDGEDSAVVGVGGGQVQLGEDVADVLLDRAGADS